jgi:acetate kinase
MARPSDGPTRVLCLNAGSSSLKAAVFELSAAERRLAQAALERLGQDDARLWVRDAGGETIVDRTLAVPDHAHAVQELIAELERAPGVFPPAAVGHRVVHGGPHRTEPARIDDRLRAELAELVPFAPLHLPAEIRCIEAVARHFPEALQVACFDTAFHRRMPAVAQRFPLPRALWDEGVRRYGFHGLSYEFVVSELGADARGRIVIAHLGNGASMAAVEDGAPIDTTMGFTPTGGLMMGTRSGDLDPGVLVHLLAARGYDAARIDELVNRESGLLGVSGSSADMKTLLESEGRDPRAAEAVALYCHHLRRAIGALAATLGGLDALVFTGGIGEHAPPVRERACAGLGHLGVALDPAANAAGAAVISSRASHCTVRVVSTNEELVVARHTRAALLHNPR